MKTIKLFGLLLLSLLVSGCATRTWNQPLLQESQDSYVFANHLPRHNSRETFIVLAFSGGGTRSAAFSYGLLEKLHDTRVTIDGATRSLLSEVDVTARRWSTQGRSHLQV